MIEAILIFIVLVIAFYAIVYGAIFFVGGVAYGYWGLSIVMAPVLWILMIIGTFTGFICAVKNAIKAARAIKNRE